MTRPIEKRIEKLEGVHNPRTIIIVANTQAAFDRQVDARIARGELKVEDRARCIQFITGVPRADDPTGPGTSV